VAADANGQTLRILVSDDASGAYHGVVDPQNPGPRPTRRGVYEPEMFLNGARPTTGEFRKELARLVTQDRQFARAAVNYLFAYLFRAGIVDPPEAWDLDRLDVRSPPPEPWALQPSHPQLLEALADDFIAGGYRIRPILRRLAVSSAYQISSTYPGTWRPEYARLFAKQTPRRLTPEELYDAVALATATQAPLPTSAGVSVERAVQLPDANEPTGHRSAPGVLTSFGRGDWWRTPRSLETSVIRVLFLMNDGNVVQRTFGSSRGYASTRVAQLATSPKADPELVDELFLSTLGRFPTAAEVSTSMGHRSGRPREDWLSNLQWALLNTPDFLFVR
jgi:hypothetical protein